MKSRVTIVLVAALLGTSALLGADENMWKRVERFDPGTRVKITVDGGAPAERYFVQLNDMIVVLLNLSAPELPKRQLLNMAIDNPAWIAGTSKTTYRDNNLRVGPDGVFVKDKKVAELNQVVEWIPRAKVTAIDK
ncbi:MAG TPA: hypothetical protein VFP91_21445 [Vicinamibacterales bacterium]|nr:hypothetical protein [Vicinamibacterales bacterium]